MRRIYEKFGLPTEWQLADQAEVIGYRAMEHQLTPDSEYELNAPTAMFWHPGVHAAMAGDTILVMPGGCEIVTRSAVWPQLGVRIKKHEVPCCGLLLIRDGKMEEASASKATKNSSAIFQGGSLPDDDTDGSRMDSVWELDMSSHQSVLDEEESAYTQESVLD